MSSQENCLASALSNYMLPHKKEFKVMQGEMNIEVAACAIVMTDVATHSLQCLIWDCSTSLKLLCL